MPLASGRASIAICDRCNFKYNYQVLRTDGNSPGLRVCENCWDPKDPWRLPPIQPDAIALKYPRPDTYIGLNAPPETIQWDTAGLTWDSTSPPLTWDELI